MEQRVTDMAQLFSAFEQLTSIKKIDKNVDIELIVKNAMIHLECTDVTEVQNSLIGYLKLIQADSQKEKEQTEPKSN